MQIKWSKKTRQRLASVWEEDRVIQDGDKFFSTLEQAIDDARVSIIAEFYIFADDTVGNRIFAALGRAAQRGIRVRMMVDGIGSAGWARSFRERAPEAGIEFKVYNELPWEVLFGTGDHLGPGRMKIWDLLRRVNNRDHRKVCIVDGATALVGSMNVIDYHVPAIAGEKAWRDTGALVRGRDVEVLIQSFERVWLGSFKSLKQRLGRRRQRPQSSDLVRLNLRSRQRHENYLDLLVRVVQAQNRVWITNAYFVPDGSLLRVLSIAAKSGVDVRILVPRFSDVFFIPWVASAFHFGLLEAGVKVFEYTRTVLHAKTMLIDDWALVGSSNLNHRSLLHDLEADVVITGEDARKALETQFELDLTHAEQITLETWSKRPFLERLAGRMLVAFRYLL